MGERELVFEDMLNELVVGAVEVVEDPCVEEFQLLNFGPANVDVAFANGLKVNLDEVLVVEFQLNDIFVLEAIIKSVFVNNLVFEQLAQVLFVLVLLLLFLEHPKTY